MNMKAVFVLESSLVELVYNRYPIAKTRNGLFPRLSSRRARMVRLRGGKGVRSGGEGAEGMTNFDAASNQMGEGFISETSRFHYRCIIA